MERDDFAVRPLAEDCIEISFGNEISEPLNDLVAALRTSLESSPFEGMRECVPAYSSLAVFFDPCGRAASSVELASAAVAGVVSELVPAKSSKNASPARTVEIPVGFGGSAGPDIAEVAEINSLSESEVIEIFLSRTYRVFMIGFLPGFAYMGTLDERIATPRRASPRTSVAAGSVGIAGNQTGVYPLDSPGGWQIIGRTDLQMFDTDPEKLSLLGQGDRVRFVMA